MAYDLEHEAKCCLNELFYRNGPTPEPLKPTDAAYALEVVQRYMRDALYSAARST